MITRTAILTALVCLLATAAALAGPQGGDGADVASAKATHMLVVYGEATTSDGRLLPTGFEVAVTNRNTGDVAVGVVGENARGIYEAVFFAPDEAVASAGDVLEFAVTDAEFEPGNGELTLTAEDLDTGMVRYDVAPDQVSSVPDDLPAFRPLSAYPNPCNPLTMIRLEQDRAGPVHLDLYDARGVLVRRLWHGVLEAGPHEVPWNGLDDAGREAPSGVYLVKLRSAGRVELEKVTLVR